MDNELNRTTHDTLTHLFNLHLEHLQVSSPKRYFPPFPSLPTLINLPFKQFTLSPDPYTWGTDLSPHIREPDDYLHTPDPHHLHTRLDFKHTTDFFSVRAMVNLGGMLLTCVGLLALLYVLFSLFKQILSLALLSSLHYFSPSPSSGEHNADAKNLSTCIVSSIPSRRTLPSTNKGSSGGLIWVGSMRLGRYALSASLKLRPTN